MLNLPEADTPHVCSVCEGSGLLLPGVSCPLCEGDPAFFLSDDAEGKWEEESNGTPPKQGSSCSSSTGDEASCSNSGGQTATKRQFSETSQRFGGLAKGFLLKHLDLPRPPQASTLGPVHANHNL